jgi:site-specific DNA-cytosine methylase
VQASLRDLESIAPVHHGAPVRLLETTTTTATTSDDSRCPPRIIYDHRIEPQSARFRRDCLEQGVAAPTLCRRNGLTHYRHDRALTLRERARLQAFPDDYHFCGRPSEQS